MKNRILWLHEWWIHFWFEPASPVNLGFCRILFFGTFFLFYLQYDFSAWGEVANVFWEPIWLFSQFHLPILSTNLLVNIQVLWKLTLLSSCVGLFTRLSTITSFIIGGYLLGLPHNFGKTHHFDAMLVFILGIMALSRCGDSWSIDRLMWMVRHGDDTSPKPSMMSGEYTWPVRMFWLVMSLVLFGAGLSKIRHSGIMWVASENMASLLIKSHYHTATAEPLTSWGLYLAQYVWLTRLIAASTIVFETLYPLALFSPKARLIVVPYVFSMLAGIRILMGPTFELFMICQLFWVPWDRVALWVTYRLRGDQSETDQHR